MPKTTAANNSNHLAEKIIKIVSSLIILGILTYPFLFYVQRGINYLPTPQYIIATLVAAAILIYSFVLVLGIKSKGKIVVLFVLLIATVLTSIALFVVFTPFIGYVQAQVVNTVFCGKIQLLSPNIPTILVNSIEKACFDLSFKTFFPYK